MNMNLTETLQSLEHNKIACALDVGEHQYCNLDSNCPRAIELRKIIQESGITLDQLLSGYQQVTAPKLMSTEFQNINCESSVNIGGKIIKVDLTEVMSSQLKASVDTLQQDLKIQQGKVKRLGDQLYSMYLQEISRLRTNKVLPQLKFNQSDLIKYKVLVTTDGSNYVFLWEALYHPDTIVNNGIRSRLDPEGIRIIARDIWLKMVITQTGKVLRVDVLDTNGEKLQHYHGSTTSDCWGTIPLVLEHGLSLDSLFKLKQILVGSIQTINFNSLMTREPRDMPHAQELLDRATKLGKEGSTSTPPVIVPRPTGWRDMPIADEPVMANEPRRWGQGR